MNRMRKVSRGLAFLGLFCNGFEKKVKILGGGGEILKKNLYICGENIKCIWQQERIVNDRT